MPNGKNLTQEALMTIDRQKFRDQLLKHSKANDSVIETIMEKTEPFFCFADIGTYRFAKTEKVDRTRLVEALQDAFSTPVDEVILLSVTSPWNNWPPYFTETLIRKSLNLFLFDGLLKRLSIMMMDEHYTYLRKNLGQIAISAFTLEEILKDTMQKPLWKSLKASMEDSFWPDDLWRELYRSINFTLTTYIGYLLSGMPDRAERIEPLIDLMPMTVPIGSMKYSQSSYLAFVA